LGAILNFSVAIALSDGNTKIQADVGA